MPAIQLKKSPNSALPFITLKLKNGLGEHNFLVDTGAEFSSLIPELVAHYRTTVRGLVCGATGTAIATKHAVTFNALHKTLTEVAKENPDSMKHMEYKLGFKVSGLIGQDLLSQFSVYAIDNKAGLFRFEL